MPHYLQEQLNPVIDSLDLTEREKKFIKERWLDQLIYADKSATRDKTKYLRLRMVTIIGGVIVPALVSLNNLENEKLRIFISWVTFGTSLTVAISAAVEEFFQYGESSRRLRNTAEGMKIEGWSFFQLSGPYADAKSHQAAYKAFASHVENIIQKDVEGYNAEMMTQQEKQKQDDDDDDEPQGSAKPSGSSASAPKAKAKEEKPVDLAPEAAPAAAEESATLPETATEEESEA